MDFPIVVAPKDEGKYAFKAIQTYDNDDKVKWTEKKIANTRANVRS